MTETNTNPNVPSNGPRNALLVGGGLALAGLGLAAGLLLRHPSPSVADSATQQPPEAASAAETTNARANQNQYAPTPTVRHTASSHVGDNERRVPAQYDTTTRPVAVCANCGVIESVRPIQQRGQGTGLGAVAGGVLGGVVGNQVGRGQGNTAMTVLGALGGGYVGNEVEKTQRASTVYEVRVRMDDGTVRTFTQRTEPAPGTHVQVDGQTFHVSE